MMKSLFSFSRRKLQYLIAVIPCLFFLERMWNARWLGDDGLINTRVVYNILGGSGPVYNIGERVEVFTSPLWIWILTLCGITGLSPDKCSVYLGLILSFAGLCFSVIGSVRLGSQLSSRGQNFSVPAGVIVYAAIPVAWDYGTSGLETGVALAWLGGSYFFLSTILLKFSKNQLRQSKTLMTFTALLGLGPLVRPELSIFSVGLFIPLFIVYLEYSEKRNSFREAVVAAIPFALIMAILPVGYQLFRMGYYAALTSNTAIAKEAFMANWGQGKLYFNNFFLLYHLGGPILILSVFLVGSVLNAKTWAIKSALICPAISGVLYTIAVVKMGGDFMHGRFFLPGLFGGLMPVATVLPSTFGYHRPISKIVVAGMMLSLIGWSIYCACFIRMTIENQHGIGDERGWYTRRSISPNPTDIKDYRRFAPYKNANLILEQQEKNCPGDVGRNDNACNRYVIVDIPSYGRVRSGKRKILLDSSKIAMSTNTVVMRDGIGIFGTVVGWNVHVVDRYGLVDPIGSRMMLTSRGRPGHEKRYSNIWMVARFGDTTQIHDDAVHAAVEALECSPLKDLTDAVSEPMTFRRFLRNISMSFEFQKLRVPENPSDAIDLFCN